VRQGATQAGELHANGRVGAPKWGCKRVMVCPCMHARGEGVWVGQWANGRVGAPKWGCEKEPATGDSVPPHACKGRGCVSRVTGKQEGACTFSAPPHPVD